MLAGLISSEHREEDLFRASFLISGSLGGVPGLVNGVLMPSREFPGMHVYFCIQIPPSEKDASCMGLGPNLIPPPPSLITSAKTISYKVTFTGTGGSVFSIFWGRGGCNSTCNTELRAALWPFHGRERKFKSLGGVGGSHQPFLCSLHWSHALFFFSLGETNDVSSLSQYSLQKTLHLSF